MRIFVSWSGADSREFAELLRRWLPRVVQAADVWVSSQDVQLGDRWSGSIAEKLASIDFGLIALTKANKVAPWILFEAGALSKHLSDSSLIPILTNLTDSDLVKTPLSQFQYIRPEKSGMFRLVERVNGAIERPLLPEALQETFDLWWPSFEENLGRIQFLEPESSNESPALDSNERLHAIETVLDEVLKTTRELKRAEQQRSKPPRHVGSVSISPSIESAVIFPNPPDVLSKVGVKERAATLAELVGGGPTLWNGEPGQGTS